MRQMLRRQLWSLAAGELTTTLVFAFVLYRVRDRFGAETVGTLAWLGFAMLAFILLQAVIYWLAASRRISQPRGVGATDATQRNTSVARVVYLINLVLLAGFPLIYVVGALRGTIDWRSGDPWFGLGLYLFALVEFIQYFVVKIVQSDRDRATRTRWQAARLRREGAR